jgi:hypothetical protein
LAYFVYYITTLIYFHLNIEYLMCIYEMIIQSRLNQTERFYSLLDSLAKRLGGPRYLSQCNGNMGWPRKGVYFFFEIGEFRENVSDPRIVRVGTHAVSEGSRTTLWDRLRAHRGTLKGKNPGGGNHRGSIFRLHIGTAILNKEGCWGEYPTWGKGSSAKPHIRASEYPIEKKVSKHIGSMPFLWLRVDDPAGKNSERAYLEKNSIALLSNYNLTGSGMTLDPPSSGWLGCYCSNELVRESGLWNANHVRERSVNPHFLDRLEIRISEM